MKNVEGNASSGELHIYLSGRICALHNPEGSECLCLIMQHSRVLAKVQVGELTTLALLVGLEQFIKHLLFLVRRRALVQWMLCSILRYTKHG